MQSSSFQAPGRLWSRRSPFLPSLSLRVWFAGALLPVMLACSGGQLAAGTHKFHLNHLGYERLAPKRIVVEANGALSSFQIAGVAQPALAFEGKLSELSGFVEWGGGPQFYVADFTGLTQAGTFEIRVNGTASPPFAIGDRLLFGATARAVLEYFRGMRASEADSSVWARDAAVPFIDRAGTADVRGGWYDASGDISKYLTHSSYANVLNPQQIPLVAWSLAWVHDAAAPELEALGVGSEMAREAAWGADYLVRAQDPSGYFYATVFDKWSGEPAQRRICAFSGMDGVLNSNYASAFREGGGMAIAALAKVARWNAAELGAFPPATYLDAARRAFTHLSEHNLKYVDDGKENIIDDYTALLAASELFAATKEAPYLDAARARAARLVERLHPSGYFVADAAERPFWHASDAGLPVVALVRYLEVEPSEEIEAPARQAIQKHLEYLVSVTNAVTNPYGYARQHVSPGKAQFFIPHENESGYWWQGENARLASLSAAALLGDRALGGSVERPLGVSPAVGALAVDQLDWILGKNPYDVCMLNGFGRNNPDPYPNDKAQSGTQPGGIANGITSRERDGEGIQWDRRSGKEAWQRWRWVEQWLPHAAWYLVAVTALALPAPRAELDSGHTAAR